MAEPEPQCKVTLIDIECNVQFAFFVPEDLYTTPFVIFASQGKHIHPPPPQVKMPLDVKKDIRQLMELDSAG